jgi:hypothetical protein
MDAARQRTKSMAVPRTAIHGPAWTKKCPPDIMRRLDLAGDEVPSCVTPRHVAQLAEAEHDADEWQAALMLVAEHEPQRPRPPDLYIRGRAGRSSADLSAQPKAIMTDKLTKKCRS